MERGDIYLVSLNPTSGYEQSGTQPVLVVSPKAFNRMARAPIVLPIPTGGNFARTAGFAVSLKDAGTKTSGIIRFDQSRALDIASRHGAKSKACRLQS
jgi:mRNA-degrading endonuclease toxin of MazEF toxin-antitoxin module